MMQAAAIDAHHSATLNLPKKSKLHVVKREGEPRIFESTEGTVKGISDAGGKDWIGFRVFF